MECSSVRCAKGCRMWISLDVVLIYVLTVALCGASLIKSPTNKAVIAGQRMEMECQTNNRSMFRKWDFLQTGNESIRTIAINDNTNIRIVPKIISGFDVDVDHNGSVLLYSNSTKTNDAGVYICQVEKGSTEFRHSAQLIVLESEPICETNLTTTTLSDGECIWMECRVNFSGNWAPTMEWRQHPLNGVNNDEGHDGHLVSNAVVGLIIQNQSVTSTLIVLIDSTNNDSYYSCRTYFTWHNGRLRTNATNVPDFNHTWTTHSTTKPITWPTTSVDSTTAKSEVTFEYVLLLFGLLSAALFLVMIATIVACCVIIRRKTAEWMAKVVSTYENRERPRSTRNSLMFSRDTLRHQTKTKSLDQQVGCREREPSEGYTSVDDLEEECNQAAGERPTTSGTPKYTSVFKKSPPVPSAPRPEPVASAHYSLAVDEDVVLDYATLRKNIEPPKWDNNHDSAESESEIEDLK